MTVAYYNENDLGAAAWLRELIAGGHIAPGEVDTRSIEDVTPNDIRGFTQCHFFAGIGGWSYALRVAGWPDERPVWTGSCPCQPFSAAGGQRGFADERHLWPSFFWLVIQCAPAIIFGEQVASKPGLEWLDLVSADLEGARYAVAAADLCAAGIGAPHIRQRLYWVAYTDGWYAGQEREQRGREQRQQPQNGVAGELDKPPGGGCERIGDPPAYGQPVSADAPDGAMGHSEGDGRQQWRSESDRGRVIRPWDDAEWLTCRDGKARPVEPGTFPLAHGLSDRVGLLRGYGNAIVPQVAAAFIAPFAEAKL